MEFVFYFTLSECFEIHIQHNITAHDVQHGLFHVFDTYERINACCATRWLLSKHSKYLIHFLVEGRSSLSTLLLIQCSQKFFALISVRLVHSYLSSCQTSPIVVIFRSRKLTGPENLWPTTWMSIYFKLSECLSKQRLLVDFLKHSILLILNTGSYNSM